MAPCDSAPPVDGEDPRVAAAMEEADDALTRAAESHDDYREAITDALADVATEALEGVRDLADLARDGGATDEQVAEAATELFEILSKVEQVSRQRHAQ